MGQVAGLQLRVLLEETKIIMTRCHAVCAIMRGELTRVGDLIARSIKRMIMAADVYIGHPFVITTLCERLQV
ncbi:hypothetical protein A2U01_0086083, partial [Trifolium medium]|nr:hypothetical protein [Trifolium medium]